MPFIIPPTPPTPSGASSQVIAGPPQFDAPFRLDGNGLVVTVAQGSPAEIGAAIYNIVVCEQGAKLNDPGFGREAPLFDGVPADPSGILDAVRRLEPRAANCTTQDILTVLDQSQATIQITATVDGANG